MLHNDISLLQNLFCRNLRCFVAKSVLSRFTRFSCGEKLNQKMCLWRKKDKYQVWAQALWTPSIQAPDILQTTHDNLQTKCTNDPLTDPLTDRDICYEMLKHLMIYFHKFNFCEISEVKPVLNMKKKIGKKGNS